MESLVASYASSDEEEERQPRNRGSTVKSSKSSSSSSSLFSVIPQPKQPRSSGDGDLSSSSNRVKSSAFLSSLPPPKSSISRQKVPAPSIPAQSKRVVQIRLPVNPRPSDLDDEDEEEEKERKKRKQMESAIPHDTSVKSFLSAMPAPKSSATLGAGPSLGSGRKSILETETPAITIQSQSGSDHNTSNHETYASYTEQISGVDDNYYAGYGGYESNASASGDTFGYVGYESNASASGDASGYVGYDSSYGGNAGYSDQYTNTWNGGEYEATTGLPEAVVAIDSGVRRGRRGRNEMPTEIIEVKQDELMKNRPREDQVKATGIAFGPAYQPATTTSSKGKPSKLHKRKHQITALLFDMRQKETELAERRSRGLLTKAETQAKYGW